VPLEITNCHVHTFTHEHVPDRFLPFPLGFLLRFGPLRRKLLAVVQHFDRGRRSRLARYAKVLEVSFGLSQEAVFTKVRSFYPRGTRFVVLPMDMEHMGAGRVTKSIDQQHAKLRELRDKDEYRGLVLPFAAVDARQEDVVEKTKRLLESGFRGIKLYPPIGYHPYDPALRPLYTYAEERGVPVMTHCSRPAGVQYRGKLTQRMLTDPVTGKPLSMGREKLLTVFTDPDSYVPILEAHPRLRVCLAHFGGAGDWKTYLERPWDPISDAGAKSWLAKILDMLRSGAYDHLYTDISYTVFADEEYVHLLKVLLSDPAVRRRVLFGSDFYVVEDAKLEERRISVRVRSLLGEDLFRTIAQDNPRSYLGET
jgi:predicted TIM-barrel fold metal-dependent hydrolase